jgi:hypothetical protein
MASTRRQLLSLSYGAFVVVAPAVVVAEVLTVLSLGVLDFVLDEHAASPRARTTETATALRRAENWVM